MIILQFISIWEKFIDFKSLKNMYDWLLRKLIGTKRDWNRTRLELKIDWNRTENDWLFGKIVTERDWNAIDQFKKQYETLFLWRR